MLKPDEFQDGLTTAPDKENSDVQEMVSLGSPTIT